MKKRLLSAVLAIVMLCAWALSAGAYDMGKMGEANTLSLADHSAVIDKDNTLWEWGAWDISKMFYGPGQYGGSRHIYPTPQKDQSDIMSVSCGYDYSAVIRKDGSLWLWGENMYGQVGVGKKMKIVYEPTKVMDDVAAVSCGYHHTAAIQNDGSLWVWGENSQCQLGIADQDDTADYSVPTKLMDDVVAVSCGDDYTAVIKEDASLWVWGNNSRGQLGNDRIGDRGEAWYFHQSTPVKVMDDVAAVCCGTWHTAAIKTDGSLWMWGSNWDGQLGTGNKDGSNVPVKVLEHVVAVSCGRDHTAAIKEDGTLWMWGDNLYGALGNGFIGNTGEKDSPDQTLPVKVLDNVSAVKCGDTFTAAIQADGSLWTWGESRYGQLGNDNGYDMESKPMASVKLLQTVPTKILDNVAVPAVYNTPLPKEEPEFPTEGTAYASTQTVTVDGKPVTFYAYALKDANGNDTNYIKLRDVAQILNGSAAQFQVGYDGSITITTKTPYTPNGSEMVQNFTGDQSYTVSTSPVTVNGQPTNLEAITLTDASGGGYTYFKLRDLGAALGFDVSWSADTGISIDPNSPYNANN